MPSLIEVAIARHRAALLAGDAEALRRMVAAYHPVRARLTALIDELIVAMEAKGGLTPGEIAKFDRATELLAQVEDELRRFGQPASSYIESLQRQAIQLAEAHALASVTAQVPSIGLAWNRVPTEAVQSLVGRLRDGSPLRSYLDRLGADTAAKMERALIDGLSLGKNPREVAREIQAALAKEVDLAGYRILQTTRTEMLGAYRTAAIERYAQNLDILEPEWEWLSTRSARSCGACLALDGTRHPISESFQKSHVQCRCTSLAIVKGTTIERETGADWFAKQDEKTQNGIIGKEAGALYRSGDVDLSDFVALRKNGRWGDSYQVASLDTARTNAQRRARRAA